jgi:hypothetical protein
MDFLGGVSESGVPRDLMFCPSSEGSKLESSSVKETRFRTWEPPRDIGLCPIACGYAKFNPGGYDLLVWHRSHGREHKMQVAKWIAYRAIAAGWKCMRMEALWIIECAMAKVRAGRTRVKISRLAHIPEKQFDRMLCQASSWLRAGVMEAEYRYWKTGGYRRSPSLYDLAEF